MESKILLLALIWSFIGKSQDTLFLKTNEFKIVNILTISEKTNLLTYLENADTMVISLNSVNNYILHPDKTIIDRDINIKFDLSPFSFDIDKERINPRLSKYRYSLWSIGINPLAVVLRSEHDDTNPQLSLYAEKLLNKNFGFRIPLKIGYIEDTRYNELIELEFLKLKDINTIIEGGVESVFFIDSRRKYSFYFTAGYYIGIYQYTIHHYYNGYIDEQSIYHEYENYMEYNQHKYNRFGLSPGLQFNFNKRISLGIEIGLYLKNQIKGQNKVFDYDLHIKDYKLRPQYTYNRYIIQNHNSFNLVYRLGGELRTK